MLLEIGINLISLIKTVKQIEIDSQKESLTTNRDPVQHQNIKFKLEVVNVTLTISLTWSAILKQ